MSKPWLKSWTCSLDKRKVMSLPGDLFKVWQVLQWVAARHDRDGLLPSLDECAFVMRKDEEWIAPLMTQLVERGLVDSGPDGYRMHDWADWQTRKPSDEPGAVLARVRKHRGQPPPDVTPRNALQNVTDSVTPCNASNAVKTRGEEKRPEETREELTQRDELTTHLAAKPPERVAYSADFEVFWKAYGKAVGKKEAYAVWKRIAPDTPLFTAILASVEAQRGGRKWLEGYQPDAVRWLKGEHWNDAVEAPRASAKVTPIRPQESPDIDEKWARYDRYRAALGALGFSDPKAQFPELLGVPYDDVTLRHQEGDYEAILRDVRALMTGAGYELPLAVHA